MYMSTTLAWSTSRPIRKNDLIVVHFGVLAPNRQTRSLYLSALRQIRPVPHVGPLCKPSPLPAGLRETLVPSVRAPLTWLSLITTSETKVAASRATTGLLCHDVNRCIDSCPFYLYLCLLTFRYCLCAADRCRSARHHPRPLPA